MIDITIIKDNNRNKRKIILKVQSKMDNPEKLATQGTQDKEKQNKNTTQYVLDTTMRKQTKIRFMVFSTSFNNISVTSWWPVLLVE